jgi:hypothetical protein
MNKSTKRIVGWGAGMGIGAALLVLIAVLIMILNAEPVAQADVDPAAGEAPVVQEEKASCDYPKEWIGKPADEKAIKKETKAYRILGPDSMATMDYSADRVNVHTDDKGIVTKVTCG